MKSAKYWIEKLGLDRHPEGGWFKEIYRSDDIITVDSLSGDYRGTRNCSTSIYYLLEGDDYSSFHRIKSDEVWHYYAGSTSIEILLIVDGSLIKQLCGNNPDENQQLQIVVPKNTWFAARLHDKSGYALVGCTVSPGFQFDDFEMSDEKIMEEFPQLETEIKNLLRIE